MSGEALPLSHRCLSALPVASLSCLVVPLLLLADLGRLGSVRLPVELLLVIADRGAHPADGSLQIVATWKDGANS